MKLINEDIIKNLTLEEKASLMSGHDFWQTQKIKRVAALLADEKSKEVYKSVIEYKLTGDIKYLFNAESDKAEVYTSLLNAQSITSYADLGAYNGDTVLDFAKRVGNVGHITAVEPDPKSFAKLTRNTSEIDVVRINAAISDVCGTIPFSFKSSIAAARLGTFATARCSRAPAEDLSTTEVRPLERRFGIIRP